MCEHLNAPFGAFFICVFCQMQVQYYIITTKWSKHYEYAIPTSLETHGFI